MSCAITVPPKVRAVRGAALQAPQFQGEKSFMAGFGSNSSPRKSTGGPVWGLGGLIVGLGLGWGGPKVLHKLTQHDTTTKKTKTVAAKPKLPSGGQALELEPLPAQKGILLASALPIKLLRPSESKRTQQQSGGVFTGFKNWLGTANYLKSGQGGLFLKAVGGKAVSTGWKAADYDKFARGIPLRANLLAGQSYTLYFQRKSQRAIDLGTFSFGTATTTPQTASKPAPAPAPAVGITPKP